MTFSLVQIFGKKETGNEIDKRLINVKLSLKGQNFNNEEQIEGTLEIPQETQEYRDSPFEGKVMGYDKVKKVFGKKPFLTKNQAEFKNKLNTMFKQGQNYDYYQSVEQKFKILTNQKINNYDEEMNKQEKFKYLTGKIEKNPQEVMQMFRGKYDVKSSVQKVRNLTRINKNDYKFDIKAMNRINVQKGLSMFGDADKDGVMNIIDCEPLNKFKQGKIHDVLGINKGRNKKFDELSNPFFEEGSMKNAYDIGSLNYINKQIMELDKKIEEEKDPRVKKALVEQKNELYKQYRHILDIQTRSEEKQQKGFPDYLKAQAEYQKTVELLPIEKQAKRLELQKQKQELVKQQQLMQQEKELVPVKTLTEYKKLEAQEKLNELQLAKTQKDIELAKTEMKLKQAQAKKLSSEANQKLFEDKLNKYKNVVNTLVTTSSSPEKIKQTFSINRSSEGIVRNNIERFVEKKQNGLDVLRSMVSTITKYPLNSVPPKSPEQAQANRKKVEMIAGGMFKNTGLSPEKAIFAKKQELVQQTSVQQQIPILSQQDFGVQQASQQYEENETQQPIQDMRQQFVQEQNNEQSAQEQYSREQYARDIVAGSINYEDIDWDNVSIDDIARIDPEYAEYLKKSAGKHKYRRGPYKKRK